MKTALFFFIIYFCLAEFLLLAGYFSMDYGQNLMSINQAHNLSYYDISIGGKIQSPQQIYLNGARYLFASLLVFIVLFGFIMQNYLNLINESKNNETNHNIRKPGNLEIYN